MSSFLGDMFERVTAFVKPDPAPSISVPVEAAQQLTARRKFSSLLFYRDFLDEHKLVVTDNGMEVNLGFVLQIAPLMIAGIDAESQVEDVIKKCPPGSVISFYKLSMPHIDGFLGRWAESRLKNNDDPLLRQITLRRAMFFQAAATRLSLLPGDRMHPRMQMCFVAIRFPAIRQEVLTDKEKLNRLMIDIVSKRAAIQSSLASIGMGSEVLEAPAVKTLVHDLVNPHIPPLERLADGANVDFARDLVDKRTRVTVNEKGYLNFYDDASDTPKVSAACITIDAFPRGQDHALPGTARTLGDPMSRDERITCPYVAYTIIQVLHPERAHDETVTRLGLLTRQTMSESAWYRSMMSHLYERKDMVDGLIKEKSKGHTQVRAWGGLTLYSPPEEIGDHLESAKGLWSGAGFRATEERFIPLPVFLASLPLNYSPAMDPPNRGLQRADGMTSLHAASLVQVQGDWRGTNGEGGSLLISRSGQVAAFDLRDSPTNYNFAVVAESGAGKSFFVNDMICDFLSTSAKSIVRIIDVGRSYKKICERLGGQFLVFQPDNPISLNPLSMAHTAADLHEMLPMMQDLLRVMAFPLTPEEQVPAWHYAALGKAVEQAWNAKGSNAGLADVYQALITHEDARARDLAFQLEVYATGRLAPWFNGPRQIDFSNRLMVLELEELKQDPQLQAVVMSLIMYTTTKEMYLLPRTVRKCLLIDEAWDVLGGVKTGKFIETAYRRIRKYNGSVGTITQSFKDYSKSEASMACVANAAWVFALSQASSSFQWAAENGYLPNDEQTLALLSTVKSGPGFSEIFVKSPTGAGVYRLITDRDSYYLYSTNAKDDNQLTALMREGKTPEQAIATLSERDYRSMFGVDLNFRPIAS